jgi:hypothetical protein
MIGFALRRRLSRNIACFAARGWKQGEVSHGLRDKSADVCRAHVVGWVGVLRRCTRCLAVALQGNNNDISGRSAVALVEMLILSP